MIEKLLGTTISSIKLENNKLLLEFKKRDWGPFKKLTIYDDGQSCCEDRFMETDDDLSSYVGQELRGFVLKPVPDEQGDWEVKECQFLEIHTDKGFITIKNYNIHNGYYSGFDLAFNIEENSND